MYSRHALCYSARVARQGNHAPCKAILDAVLSPKKIEADSCDGKAKVLLRCSYKCNGRFHTATASTEAAQVEVYPGSAQDRR